MRCPRCHLHLASSCSITAMHASTHCSVSRGRSTLPLSMASSILTGSEQDMTKQGARRPRAHQLCTRQGQACAAAVHSRAPATPAPAPGTSGHSAGTMHTSPAANHGCTRLRRSVPLGLQAARPPCGPRCQAPSAGAALEQPATWVWHGRIAPVSSPAHRPLQRSDRHQDAPPPSRSRTACRPRPQGPTPPRFKQHAVRQLSCPGSGGHLATLFHRSSVATTSWCSRIHAAARPTARRWAPSAAPAAVVAGAPAAGVHGAGAGRRGAAPSGASCCSALLSSPKSCHKKKS